MDHMHTVTEVVGVFCAFFVRRFNRLLISAYRCST
jgi:hypothetical protein